MGSVVQFPKQANRELSYEELAEEIGMSVRWLRYRVKDGLPHRIDYAGRKRFLLSECRPWLDDWHRRNRRSA